MKNRLLTISFMFLSGAFTHLCADPVVEGTTVTVTPDYSLFYFIGLGVLLISVIVLFVLLFKLKSGLQILTSSGLKEHDRVSDLKDKLKAQEKTIVNLTEKVNSLESLPKEEVPAVAPKEETEVATEPKPIEEPKFPEQVFFANPNDNLTGFDCERLKTDNTNKKSCFTIIQYAVDKAYYTVSAEDSPTLILIWDLMNEVLTYDIKPAPNSTINVIRQGELILEGTLWRIDQKLQIEVK